MKEKALLEAVRLFGTRKSLAKALGVKPQSINNWLNRDDNIPYEYVIMIEHLTKGKITVEQLAPYENIANEIIKTHRNEKEKYEAKINIQQNIIKSLIDFNYSLLKLLTNRERDLYN